MQVLPFMRFGPIHEVHWQKKMRHMMQIRCSGGADAKPAFKAQVDTFTANAEVVDQLEVVSKHGVSAFLGSEPQPLTSPASASDVKAHAARAKVDFKFKLEYKSTVQNSQALVNSPTITGERC